MFSLIIMILCLQIAHSQTKIDVILDDILIQHGIVVLRSRQGPEEAGDRVTQARTIWTLVLLTSQSNKWLHGVSEVEC